MMYKTKMVFILLLFSFALVAANARQKVTTKGGYTLYFYDDTDEFYDYWINAAQTYPLVYIDVIRNENGARNGAMSSLLYEGTLTFAINTTYWQLGATFMNSRRSDMTEGRYFYLPSQIEQAIKYWDTQRSNM